ncbi:PE-PGRS family protein [Streptacidiphilus sp. N1-3]|uniref:PE-PGRS family protein n=1 Tax=Streptacidiphilus alkalitolerans TaxID=3342712 RepID=A0ABV6X413_9ACTN
MPDFRQIPEWSQSARRNSAIVDPVAVVRQVSRIDHLTRRPTANADRALVFSDGSGKLDAFLPPLRPGRAELTARGYRTVYEVDMGIHHLELVHSLPSQGDAFSFQAEIDVTWQVSSPALVVSSGIRDVPAMISPRIQSLMRAASRKFSVEDSADAESAVQESLYSRPIAEDVGLRITCTARLDLDAAAREHQSRLRGIKYDMQAATPEFEYLQLRAQQEQALLAQKADFYRYYLERGGIQQWALQVAQHPDDMRHALESLRQDEQIQVQNQMHLIENMIENGTFEDFQLEEPAKEALRQLKHILAPASAPPRPSDPPPKPQLPPGYPTATGPSAADQQPSN